MEYQEKLQQSNEETKRANQAKSEFLSHMSHDIRTPINGIMGMVEIIKKNLDDPERIKDCLEKIDKASHHLLSLINDVLDMSKIGSGEGPSGRNTGWIWMRRWKRSMRLQMYRRRSRK